MPDATPTATPATPPAPAAGFDPAAFEKKMLATIETAIGAAVKPIGDALGKLQEAARPAEQAAAAAVKEDGQLTLDAVKQLLATELGKLTQTQQTQTARQQYAAEKMKDLPAIYAQQLPQSADPAELAKAEATIRAQYAADLKAAGLTPPAVAGTPPATGAAATRTPADTSKMTGAQLIAAGIKDRPVQALSAADQKLAQG